MKMKLLLNHYVIGFSEPDVAVNEVEVDVQIFEIDGLKFTPEALIALGDYPDAIYKIERGMDTLNIKVINNGTEEDT